MRRAVSFLLAVLLALTLAAPALAADPVADYYVTDKPGVLSAETVQEVLDFNAALETVLEAQFVVVIIPYFGSGYADEYAVRAFNDREVSSMGLLLAVSTEENRGGMTSGAELAGRMSNRDMEELLDKYFWNKFEKHQYDAAVTSLINALRDWYEKEYSVSLSESGGAVRGQGIGDRRTTSQRIFLPILRFLLNNPVLMMGLVFLLISYFKGRKQYRQAYRTSHTGRIPSYFWYALARSLRASRFQSQNTWNSSTHSGGSSWSSGGGFSSGGTSFHAPRGGGFGGHSSGGFGGRR